VHITCEPSGLILNLRGLRPGDIHDVLESLRGTTPGGDDGGAAMARRLRQMERRKRRGGGGEDDGEAIPMEPQGVFGGGTLVGEILNRLQEPPYVLDVGAYGGTLAEGRPVDFRKVLITDIESAIYRCRQATGMPIIVQPNCNSCGRVTPDPLEIDLSTVDHWSCSDAGLQCLSGGASVEIVGQRWTVTLAPPTLARTVAIDKILAQPGMFPVSLRVDSTLLSSIGVVVRNAEAVLEGASVPPPEVAAVDRAVGEVNTIARVASGPKDVLSLPLDIIQWWHTMDDWRLRQDIQDEIEDLWGGIDAAYTWTCKADSTICNMEQDGRIPLDLSFFGLGTAAGRRRRNR